jgi:hypothetical protein
MTTFSVSLTNLTDLLTREGKLAKFGLHVGNINLVSHTEGGTKTEGVRE